MPVQGQFRKSALATARSALPLPAQPVDATPSGNQSSASQTVTVAETGPTVTIAVVEGNNVINAPLPDPRLGESLSGSVDGTLD
jgi:hypothetical protein